jgi:hypothetical protein
MDMDDFLEKLVGASGIMAVVGLTIGFPIAFFSGFAAAAIPLIAGSIGLVIYLIATRFD